MRDFPTSASSFMNDFHHATMDDIASIKSGKLETQGPSLLSFEFSNNHKALAAKSTSAPDGANDYFQLVQLSDELYGSASCFNANPDYHHIANLKNVMGFVVGPSFFAATPAGDIVSSEQDNTAYLFSAPINET